MTDFINYRARCSGDLPPPSPPAEPLLSEPDTLGCAPLLASQEENEWPREDHTNPFAQPERAGIVRVHQKSQHQPGAKVEPDRRTTAPDSRAHATLRRRRHQPRRPPLAKIRPGSPAPTIGSVETRQRPSIAPFGGQAHGCEANKLHCRPTSNRPLADEFLLLAG